MINHPFGEVIFPDDGAGTVKAEFRVQSDDYMPPASRQIVFITDGDGNRIAVPYWTLNRIVHAFEPLIRV